MKISPKKAIAAKCRECIYDDHPGNGTMLEQIEGCTSYACPLFELRPVTRKTRQERDKNYLAGLTPTERAIIKIRRENSKKRLLEQKSLDNAKS
jgi:hypothetical protein